MKTGDTNTTVFSGTVLVQVGRGENYKTLLDDGSPPRDTKTPAKFQCPLLPCSSLFSALLWDHYLQRCAGVAHRKRDPNYRVSSGVYTLTYHCYRYPISTYYNRPFLFPYTRRNTKTPNPDNSTLRQPPGLRRNFPRGKDDIAGRSRVPPNLRRVTHITQHSSVTFRKYILRGYTTICEDSISLAGILSAGSHGIMVA